MRHTRSAVGFIGLSTAVLLAVGCGARKPIPRQTIENTEGSITVHGDIWVDNWFALYVGDQLIIEDSVSIETERSFNAESFSFQADYPIVLNLIAKDFKENDSGLEYIGSRKQQLGDGGLIAQFRDAKSGELLTASNANWQCLVLHHGPTEESCAELSTPVPGQGPCNFLKTPEPVNWKSIDYDSSTWKAATVHSASEVRPKGGYEQISWDEAAELIWSQDLKKDNTILFRIVINQPNTSE